ncbi:MAG: diguanylate cyclase [Aquabacterium sp.]|nr:diguanylate cyclase [Aquabacterium sp.]
MSPPAAPGSAATDAAAPPTPAQIAKAALRHLAVNRLEPTPENYARAWQAEGGAPPAAPPAPATPASEQPAADPAAEAEEWATTIAKLLRGIERGSRQWTTGRKKDSLQRVLDGSRSHPQRLRTRLRQLASSWDGEPLDDAPDTDMAALLPLEDETGAQAESSATAADAGPAALLADGTGAAWSRIVDELHQTVQAALLPADAATTPVAQALNEATAPLAPEPPLLPPAAELVTTLQAVCTDARRVLQHRQHLLQQLTGLCEELTDSLCDLAEDESWVRGQCEAMRHQIAEGLNTRGVRRISQLLHDTRERQQRLRAERNEARQALKQLIHQMLQEIAELGSHTDRFTGNLGRYAEVIGSADSLQSLAGVVREMLEDSRAVQAVVSQAQQRLQSEHARATELTDRVRELEDEIRRLSDEVSTDPLTQIANRRGLMRAFEAEQSRAERQSAPLSIALLDVDNFKKLNDTLGHQVGDDALRFLADQVRSRLRPVDVLARYGGEEFVILLPDTPAEEAQRVVTRLQRELSAELFMQQGGDKVFITFSAGVTPYRASEALEAALDRADLALYEAKRTGKNRTCVA